MEQFFSFLGMGMLAQGMLHPQQQVVASPATIDYDLLADKVAARMTTESGRVDKSGRYRPAK